MPSDFALKSMNAVHRLVRTVSGERFGWRVNHMTALELTTTGRKSGRQHSVMLTSPIDLGGHAVVVASRGGDDRHPAWFLNLRANPHVRVRFGHAAAQEMRARVLGAAERQELWPQITADHANYAAYQAKTTREIPLVVLEPPA